MSTVGHDGLPSLAGNPLLDEWRRLGALSCDDPVRQRLVRRYAYGIPNDAALDAIAAVAPAGVVEVGAGTGYWARLLFDRGVDVVAYDIAPPSTGANLYVDAAPPWFAVKPGGEEAVERHADRTLLLVWPTRNEIWASDAAARYHAAGGETTVYVGEGPGGRTGDATLHALLGIHGPCLACVYGVRDAPCICAHPPVWRRTVTIDVPRWAEATDTGGIFTRESAGGRARVSRRRGRRDTG